MTWVLLNHRMPRGRSKSSPSQGRVDTSVSVHYRRLNERTVKDVYPNPRIDDCLDFLGYATVLHILDSSAGYWQILFAADDRDRTTFTSPSGLYCFLRRLFGLVNVPAPFQRALDINLSGLRWQIYLVHVDDFIVFSHTADDYIRHLWELLLLLETAGVSLKPFKCHYFQNEVQHLGNIVKPGQLLVKEKSIKSLAQALSRRNHTEIKSFLGMRDVYTRFIKVYAPISNPLTELTNKTLSQILEVQQLKAFRYPTERLASTPILALPRLEGLFVLDMDACAVQVGCTLLQQQPDESILSV